MRPARRVRSVEYGLRLFQPLKRHQFSALSQAVRIRALEAAAILKAVCPQPVWCGGEVLPFGLAWVLVLDFS